MGTSLSSCPYHHPPLPKSLHSVWKSFKQNFCHKRGKLLHESLSSKRCKAIPITFDTVPVVEDVSVENRVSHCKSGQRECCSSFSPLCVPRLFSSPAVYCPSFSGHIFMLDSRLCICHQWQPSPEITQCVSREDTEEKRKERSQVAKYFYVW